MIIYTFYDWLAADKLLTPRPKFINLNSFSAPVRQRLHNKI